MLYSLIKPIAAIIAGLAMSTLSIYNFNEVSDITDWYVVNDGVMGGVSKGTLQLNDAGNGVFRGTISLQYNGGFSSIRYPFSTKEVSGYEFLVLRVKGDGKRYQFRVKSKRSQYYSYVAYFETSGEWETIRIPLNEMYPVFRGSRLNQPKYDGALMEEVGILIGNKKAEAFQLEIDSIYLESDN